jgi:hypothetical protein
MEKKNYYRVSDFLPIDAWYSFSSSEKLGKIFKGYIFFMIDVCIYLARKIKQFHL